MSVLLDTGLFLAYLHADDARHAEGLNLMDRIARRDFGNPFVSDHVIDELLTLIRSRTRSPDLEEAARRFLPLPEPTLKGLLPVSLGTAVLAPAWDIYRKYRDQRISFTDAALIVTMRELGIDRLATLDARLAKLVPSAT